MEYQNITKEYFTLVRNQYECNKTTFEISEETEKNKTLFELFCSKNQRLRKVVDFSYIPDLKAELMQYKDKEMLSELNAVINNVIKKWRNNYDSN